MVPYLGVIIFISATRVVTRLVTIHPYCRSNSKWLDALMTVTRGKWNWNLPSDESCFVIKLGPHP